MTALTSLLAHLRRRGPIQVACDRCGFDWWLAPHLGDLPQPPEFAHTKGARRMLPPMFGWSITPSEWVCAACLHNDAVVLDQHEVDAWHSLVTRFGGEQS